MKQPAYTRGSYKKHPLKQWSVRVHEHEKELVKQYLKTLRDDRRDITISQ